MTKEEVFEVVKENIIQVLPYLAGQEIAIESKLKDMGANSVDRMEIVTMSMESLGVKVPLVELAKVNNIEGLVDVLLANAIV